MKRKSKPSRQRIKQAIRRMSLLTGIELRYLGFLSKDKIFLRNIRSFAKIKRMYPTAVEIPATDSNHLLSLTVEFNKES